MKKNIYLLLMLIVTLSICSCNSEKKNDLKEKNLKGRVKYVEEKNYSVIDNFGEIDKGKLVSLFTFNKDGNILYAIESIYKKKFVYDSKGYRIEWYKYKSNDHLDCKGTYKYDSKGNMIEKTHCDDDGSLINKETYINDSKGNIIEMNTYYASGGTGKTTYQYDSKGNLIEEVFHSGLKGKITYKYDSKGNMIEENISDDMKIVFSYDSNGNMIIKQIVYGLGAGTYYKYEYEYDSKDNWIKKIEKNKKGEAIRIIERKIVYYGDKDENNYPQWDTPSLQK